MAVSPDYRNVKLSDPGEVREMFARWVITGTVTLETATRFGGRSQSAVDMPVLRDPKDGVPLLPGSTLTGALRSHVADLGMGYSQQEVDKLTKKLDDIERGANVSEDELVLLKASKAVALLFGGGRGDDQGAQSPLIVFDSLGSLPDKQTIEIRDSVQIDGAKGTAANNLKFDGEVLPAGTTFRVRFELVVSSTDEFAEVEQLRHLTAALDALSNGEVSLGARRTRGMGRLSAKDWRANRFDLATSDGWIEWLTSSQTDPLPAESDRTETASEACLQAWSKIERLKTDNRKQVRIKTSLRFNGGVLVRSSPRTADGPDVMHLNSGGQSVLPGTSTAGALRARAVRIARTVLNCETRAAALVDDMFGPEINHKQKSSDSKVKPHGSKLRITEALVEQGKRQRPTRIRIDRFTQGVFESALFDEEPHYGGRVEIHFELRNHNDAMLGLLLLLTKDLMLGDIALGGAASVGRGRVTGTATLSGLGEHTIELATPTADDLQRLNGAIAALRNYGAS